MTSKNICRLLATTIVFVLAIGMTSYAYADENGISTEPSPDAAAADAVTADGTWYEYSFISVGVDAKGCSPADPLGGVCAPSLGTPTVFAPAPAWTFVCETGDCWITVTDAFLYGDEFEVFDFGVSLGTTPDVAIGGTCLDDPEVCLADPLSSHAMFNLAGGPHSITITPVAVVTLGAAYFKIVQHQVSVGGSSLPLDTTALFVSGIFTNAFWMIPTIAGIAGAGVYFTKSRWNKTEA